MLNSALSIIFEEHRSLRSVLQGLSFLVGQYSNGLAPPDIDLLDAILGYLEEFPQKLHHPKEDAYLFAAMAGRSAAADKVIADLMRQHREEDKAVKKLRAALEDVKSCKKATLDLGLNALESAANRYSAGVCRHMDLEESVLLPMAERLLTVTDWVRIGEAFGENGDPRFIADRENAFAGMFLRLRDLAAGPR